METPLQNAILTNFKNENLSKVVTDVSYMHESKIFRSLLGRVTSVIGACGAVGQSGSKPSEKTSEAGTVTLPGYGIQTALEKWLLTHDYKKEREYPICHLPPPKSCNVTSYSIIIMSHTVEDISRLKKLMVGIQGLSGQSGTAEIILVWNSDKEILTGATHRCAKKILFYAEDESHPLRIFYSLENGLENNLLNRYHPMLKPTQEVVMYFDDDGPFFREDAMEAGLKLWQFNSDTQVGSMSRNFRFTSDRMRSAQISVAESAAKLINNDAWQTHVSPNDELRIAAHEDNSASNGFPEFIPLCHNETGDTVEYNYHNFPNFDAYMFLPSGTFLHRNFLCFIWHPVFAELRQFTLDHPTHPDDMVISTLVSHLSGKGLRSFSRRIQKPRNEELPVVEDDINSGDIVDDDLSRRRLLWEQDKWGDMREDAINIILRYFGSINPGSVGWCAGTKYCTEGHRKSEENSLYRCEPQHPTLKDIPWINEGGLGYNQCH
eukprot:CAMPEP_0198270404 /NCGR_PEP_ID=MMETSP1447-20131203/44916_1 /TAXON_ID=420782 /ORGANISM="Chaetoceros dichaeta, Strain CCMP1751" /LENGTH=490 /DNA_ID=CAMNT_0043962423 /DNA_START=162 /DNA_END=1634 /DNA_ORIENTATION=+